MKTTIGGALSALGKTLMGIGVVPQLSGAHNEMLTYVAVAGFFLDALGGFFGHLYAAEASELKDVQAQMKLVPAAINSSDTSILTKNLADNPTKP